MTDEHEFKAKKSGKTSKPLLAALVLGLLTLACGQAKACQIVGVFPGGGMSILCTDPVVWIPGHYGNPWLSAAHGDVAYIIGDNSTGHTSQFGVEFDNISASGCSTLLNYFSKSNSEVYGSGSINGLIGTNVAGSSAPNVPAFWEQGAVNTFAPATNCTSSNGLNSVIVWFDMKQM